MKNEDASKDDSLTFDRANAAHIPKVFVVCTRTDTAPVWGYILREQGLTVILETSLEKAIDRWSIEIPDLVVIDIDIVKDDPMELYKKFREVSVTPILLLLPVYHENQILEAYAAGVDDVIIKPVSPPIFLAKILAWGRRSWTVPLDTLKYVSAGNYRLDPASRSMIGPYGPDTRLTNLEFRLLHLLMGRPGHVFNAEEIIQSIWGGYGEGDQTLLKNVVYRLRRKIEADPSHPLLLQTWHGGYCFGG